MMYSFGKSATQYGFSPLHESSHRDDNGDEYTYADDPKDGNDSSAEEEKKGNDRTVEPRLSKSAAPSMLYLRAQARRQSQEKKAQNSDDSDDDDDDDTDSCYSLPWRLVQNNFIEDLEFYKNAGKYT